MNILITLLTVLDVLIALLIIALVLVQQSKSGGGLGTTFGGGGSDSLFGAHASTHLGRLTVVFATLFLVITLSLAIISAHRPKNKNLMEINSMLTSNAGMSEKQPLTKLPDMKNEAVPSVRAEKENRRHNISGKTEKSVKKDIDKSDK
jgi:preprotein translocase subunit SecG